MKDTKFLFVVIVSMLVISWSNVTTSAASAPVSGGVLKYIYSAGPAGTFGWSPEARGVDALNIQPCLETIVRLSNDGTVKPALATKWTVAPDLKSVTLALRKGVKFHDGSDFNAQVCKWNLEQLMAGKVSGTQFWDSIQVVDDFTIQINLKEYTNMLWNNLSGGAGRIVSEAAYNANGLDWMRTHPVGTGPFKFVSFESGANMKFTRFDGYWGGKPLLDGVEILYVPDPSAQEAMMETGEGDMLATANPKIVSDLLAKGIKGYISKDGTVALFPDSANAGSPFANPKVRQALSYAVDRNAIAKMFARGIYDPAFQLAPPDKPGYMPNFQGTEYNPAKAKALLKEAGYGNGIKTQIIPMPGPVNKDVVVAIQAYLNNVGIKSDIAPVTMGAFTNYRMQGWTNAILCQPLVAFPNYANTAEYYFNSKQFPSLARPAGLKDLCTTALASVEIDPANSQAVSKLLSDDETVVPIHYMGTSTLWTSTVHGANYGDYAIWYGCDWDKVWLSK
jgi:peptide/nickel transport system substrate-binding protein